ncbi:hypothetical protein MJN69_27020, partial [Salmonella enterica subsp. enterica serovar Kentucky]|nr:hypothetical protein [Salmonella enterica subsp. enterica serovar Kentucky]
GHIGHGAILHGCVVGRDALVGMNSVIMDGAVIGEESIVAAMSPKHPAQSLNALKSMPVPLRCAPRDGLTTEGFYAVPLPDRDEA